ncbi:MULTISPECIES: hypothetical protein [Pseudomonas syringae group]|uniref:Uncharacterized protein n=1 Tax=Pseudomonas syringae pv. persicae TaxID=237306 RepID=A0AB38EGV1_9PSED|nr:MULTISPECIES: hypothetical protein [Pseudomonas syringae group]MBI6727669.1 hypothetical protein [Pseudomonas amygdali]MBI6810708.1 hypothetical protein [Pseudomonas amygdali]PHN65666.1 hypothetical protein AO286_21700 [Pseudomonas syringae]RMR17987.1 hypothetical protein ALP89_02149 [Pseudomonas syringae pv. persicae]SOQ10331.1 hypothetical protein CFBP1573P_03028 [Pseudomonas syringae pv. persicae]
MTTTLIANQTRQSHLRHLRESIERLHEASSGWSAADRERGLKTIANLERQVESVKLDLFRVA